MTDPKVYILILNFRKWRDAKDCLASVLQSTYRNFTAVIVDNHSENDSLRFLAEWLRSDMPAVEFAHLHSKELRSQDVAGWPKIVLVQNESNRGFAAGNNVVLNILKEQAAWVWLLNPDMLVSPTALEKLLAFSLKEPPESIIGAQVRFHEGNQGLFFFGGGRVNFAAATIRPNRDPEPRGLDYISGGCLFTRARNFERVGLLPEEYFLYWEETDWCYRAKLNGYRLSVCPDAIVHDKVSTVIGKGYQSDYYYARNGLLFISKYRRANIPLVLLLLLFRCAKRILFGQTARARGAFMGMMAYLKMKR